MKRVIVEPGAQADIRSAFRWYEGQKIGLGREFLQEIRRMVQFIRSGPESYAVVHRNVRRANLRRFPYGLFFRLQDESVIVIACIHGHRNPRQWMTLGR
ncbi:MAG: type II toxin-antitoxin system RelE/ParE family toxin [Bryobacterales bacterium]|nr:type II toxin-antitoxin system RelE/ParE family toxin [Bryobacterales bacterium]